MSIWYAVRRGLDVRVSGPHDSWQAACLKLFGVIDDSMRVKSLGPNGYWAQKRKWVEQRVQEKEGWFAPYLPTGFSLTGIGAMGPPEIAAEMIRIGRAVQGAATAGEVEALRAEADPYLPHLPVAACAKFGDLVNSRLEKIDVQTQHA